MSRCPWKLAYLIDFDHHRDTKTRFYVTLLNYDSPLIRDRSIEIIVSKEITYISDANAKKAITLSAGLIELSNKTCNLLSSACRKVEIYVCWVRAEQQNRQNMLQLIGWRHIPSSAGHVEGSRAFSRYRTIDIDMKKNLVKILEGKQ